MKIENIAVVGAGVMGLGITQVIAQSGFKVSLFSRRGARGLERLHERLKRAVVQGILTNEQVDLTLSRIRCTSSIKEAVEEADLVIETVSEDLDLKRALFREIENYCPENAMLASNTSSLSIYKIALVTNRPDKVIGMHFFNPASAMRLVEVVKTSLTSQATVGSIVSFSKKIGKTPLIVKDTPGFIVNRCLMPIINEAAYLLMDKTATAETIDSAIKLGANHPMGPLALADLIGIDICLQAMREIKTGLGNGNLHICPLLETMVAEGKLGRKTGRGFYSYKTR